MRARTGIFIAVVALAAAFFVSRISRLYDDFATVTLDLNWSMTAASLALLVLGFCAMAANWWLVLRGVGASHPPLRAFNSFALTQFSKYLPGAIWPILGRAAMLSGNKPRLFAASAAEAGIKVVAALALSILLIDTRGQLPAWAIGIVLAIVLVLLRPQVLAPLVRVCKPLLGGRDLDLSGFDQRFVSLALIGSALTWVLIGLAYALFVTGFGQAPLSVLVGAFALAWAIGFLVVPVPAGIGVREVVLVVVTTPYLTEPTALVLALAARVWWMAGDALFFALGLLTRRIASRTDP